MAVILAESFESGTNGGTVTKALTAFNSLAEAGWTFSNAHVVSGQGALAGHVSVTAAHALLQATYTARTSLYVTMFLYPVSAPSVNVSILRAGGAGAALGEVQFTTGQTLTMRNSGFVKIAETPASFVPLGGYVRVEWMLNTTTDQQRLRVFKGANLLGTTPDYDSGLVTTTAVGSTDTVTVGPINAVTWEAYLDAFTVDDAAWVSFSGSGSGGTPLPRASNSVSLTDATTSTGVAVPASGAGGTVAAGDTAYLIFFGSTSAATQTGPSGWSHQTGQATAGLVVDVWTKTLAAGDLGSTLTVTSTNTVAYKRQLHLVIFSAAQVGAVTSALATVAATGHQTPSATAVDPQALVLNAVADRGSPSSTAWTLPANLTLAQQLFGAGGGSVSSVTATDDLVGSGAVGSNTVTGTLSTATAAMVTAVVEPATAALGQTVNAGPDLTVEPWSAVSITATGTGTPTARAWTQVTPPLDQSALTLSGASTATVTFTAPPAIVAVTYKLRATFTYAGGGVPPFDDVNVTVLPVTRRFVSSTGLEVPLRVQAVT